MRKLVLRRTESSSHGTFGVLLNEDNVRLCFTIELPWKDNKPNVSCIPTGVYKCDYTYSPAFKRNMYIVQNVKGRSGIRIHKGNVAGDISLGLRSDFKGCIGLGSGMAVSAGGQKMITHSAAAINTFEDLLDYESFELTIL